MRINRTSTLASFSNVVSNEAKSKPVTPRPSKLKIDTSTKAKASFIEELDWDKIFDTPHTFHSALKSPLTARQSGTKPFFQEHQPRKNNRVLSAKSPNISPMFRSSKTIINNDTSNIYLSEDSEGDKACEQVSLKDLQTSLIQIRSEAKICLESSQQIFNVSRKRIKSNSLSTEPKLSCLALNNEMQKDLLSDLDQSLRLLNERILYHENANLKQEIESNMLKIEANELQGRIEDREYLKSKSAKCTMTCCIT